MKQRLILTGAGSLGKGFINYFLKLGDWDITVVDNSEWALAELKELPIKLVLDDYLNAPEGDLLIHTAAYKHVDLCEENEKSSYKNNVTNVAGLFLHSNTKRKIFISTDKAVNPKGKYGQQKMEAEDKVSRWGAVVVRMGNLKGSSGSCYPLWEKQIEEGKPLTITDWKMKRYFIDIDDVVEKIMNLFPHAKMGDIIIPDCGKEVELREIVNDILTKKGKPLDYPVKIIGIKPGEKLREELTNNSEKEIYSDKNGKIYRRW